MKSKYFIILLAIILFGCTGDNEWITFKTEGCSIQLPGGPRFESRTINSIAGELTMNAYVYDASKKIMLHDDDFVYMIGAIEYPDSLMNSDDKERLPDFFKNGIDGALNKVNGKLLEEKSIDIDGFPGKEIRMGIMEGAGVITCRFYIVKNKMYIIQVFT